uniref:RNA binding motif protein 18 n=1 Tax=Buteo japonicus TaxID=224669 RepID=A0A8C0HNG8_9AVES
GVFQRYSWTGIQWDKLSLLSVSCTYRRLINKEKRLFTSESVLTKDLLCLLNCLPVQEAEKAIQCLNGKLALSKKLVVRWAHAQVKRYDHNKNEKILPISLEPSSSTEPPQSNLSVSAKIKAIEAKLKMMAENPDAEYPAAPVYSYFKPPDKKRTTPYSRAAWKSRR